MSDLQQLIQRGKEAYEERDYAAALTAFQEVLRRNPRFADIRHLTGLCLSLLGHPDAALQEFNEAIALNGRYIEAHINRAITLNDLGRFDEAQLAFAQAAEFETESEGPFPAAVSARLANAHAHVGDLYLEAGAPTEAAEQYRAALEMRPLFHDIRNRLAQALLQLGELEAAARELESVLSANARFLAARLNLGLVFFRQGASESAAREWELARKQQPANPQVRAYLAMLERKAERASH
ncbi:MAG: tetratricopeptide repeat protein [Gemmatimonadota bacterium]